MANITNYADYSTDDFIKDEYFQHWVYHPDAESIAFWRNFLLEHPEKASLVDESRKFLELLDFHDGDVFESRINALKTRIDFAIEHPDRAVNNENLSEQHRSGKRRGLVLLKVAAAIALLIMSVIVINRYPAYKGPEIAQETFSEQSTLKGERTLISLDDGTKIWLNVDSRIRYPETFDGKSIREVSLEGEAFFDVTRDETRPFIVRTQGVQIRVLGTSFNVKSYEKEDQIQTTLVEGKVTIESIDDQPKVVTLSPNQMATYHKQSKKIVLNNQMDKNTSAGWLEGRLIFDNKPLSEIVVALERWYDVRIKVDDEKSLRCHFSAKIENLSLQEVLELFKASDGIDYTIDGQEVTIRGAICKN